MRLSIATPLTMAVDVPEVRSVRAEDESGSFGILPGHADFLTALAVCVISWRDPQLGLHHAAVNGGSLSVTGGDQVMIATPEAVVGTDLGQLETDVLARFRRQAEEEHEASAAAHRMSLVAIRTIVRLLRPDLARPGSRLDTAGFST